MTTRHYVPLSSSPDWAAGVVANRKLMLGEQRRSMGNASFRNDGAVGKVWVDGDDAFFALVFGYDQSSDFGGALPVLKYVLRNKERDWWMPLFLPGSNLTKDEMIRTVRALYDRGHYGYVASLYYTHIAFDRPTDVDDEDVIALMRECASMYWFISYGMADMSGTSFYAYKKYYDGLDHDGYIGVVSTRTDVTDGYSSQYDVNDYVFKSDGSLLFKRVDITAQKINKDAIVWLDQNQAVNGAWPIGYVQTTRYDNMFEARTSPFTPCLAGTCYLRSDSVSFNGTLVKGGISDTQFVFTDHEYGVFLVNYFGYPDLSSSGGVVAIELQTGTDEYFGENIFDDPDEYHSFRISYPGMTYKLENAGWSERTKSETYDKKCIYLGRSLPGHEGWTFSMWGSDVPLMVPYRDSETRVVYLVYYSYLPQIGSGLVSAADVALRNYGVREDQWSTWSLSVSSDPVNMFNVSVQPPSVSHICTCNNTLFGLQYSNNRYALGVLDLSTKQAIYYDKSTLKGGWFDGFDDEGNSVVVKVDTVKDILVGPVNDNTPPEFIQNMNFNKFLSRCEVNFMAWSDAGYPGLYSNISDIIIF